MLRLWPQVRPNPPPSPTQLSYTPFLPQSPLPIPAPLRDPPCLLLPLPSLIPPSLPFSRPPPFYPTPPPLLPHPQVRAAITDAELHVYYGFWPYAMWAEQPHLVSLKRTLEPMLKQPGVYYHGMVSERDLAKGYASAGGISLSPPEVSPNAHTCHPPPNPPPPACSTRCHPMLSIPQCQKKAKTEQTTLCHKNGGSGPLLCQNGLGAGTFCAKMGWERAPFVLKPGRLPLRLLCVPLG